MNRIGLWIALGSAVAVGVVFGLAPTLDLAVARLFYRPDTIVWLGNLPSLQSLRALGPWLIALVAAPAVVAPLLKLVMPKRPMLVPGRAIVLMMATLAIGPGLLTNTLLKDYWHRPRPIDVAEFGGDEHFVAWWDPRGDCPKNCSFVAGEPSGAFWTLAPAALAPPPWRFAAYAAALTFGAGIGVLRMAAGGHFFSDVAFAGIFTFLVVWLGHQWLYRRSSTATLDGDIERALESVAMRLRGQAGSASERKPQGPSERPGP